MPLDAPRQDLRLLHQLLRVVLAEMLDLGLLMQRQDIRRGLELRDRHQPDLALR